MVHNHRNDGKGSPNFDYRPLNFYLDLFLIFFSNLLFIQELKRMALNDENMDDKMVSSFQPSLERMDFLLNQDDLAHNSLELLGAKISQYHLDVKRVRLKFSFS
jgi:hypothetical protein